MNKHPIFQMFDRPIAFHRPLVTLTGSITAALMLSQAIYWSQRTRDPDGWFHKTQAEWEEETGMTRREQETARKKLRQFDWWQEELHQVNGRPVTHYRIDPDGFAKSICTNAPNGFARNVHDDLHESAKSKVAKTPNPIYKDPETTTETTTETTKEISGADAPLPAPPSDTQVFAECLCWVCYGHQELSKLTERSAGQVRSEAARLVEDGYTPTELRRWYLEHWKQDWRYRKNGERPNPHQVRELIPIIRDAANANPYAAVNDSGPPTEGVSESDDPSPTNLDDPWARLVHARQLQDASRYGDGTSLFFRNSWLEAAGEVDGVPHFIIHTPTVEAASYMSRSIKQLRMDLGIEMGLRSILLTVAAPYDTPMQQPEEATAPN